MPLPNIIQMEDDLKNVSDEQLVEYMRNPPSGVPQFLTLQEMDRRREMRESFQATQGQPQQSIAQELTSYTAGGGQQGPQGQQGIGSLPAGSAGGAEMQSRMNGNAPVPYRGGQVQSMGQPQGQATSGAPPMPKGMASGGIVGYQNRGQVGLPGGLPGTGYPQAFSPPATPSTTEQLVRQLLPHITDPAQIAMIVQTVGEIAAENPAAMRGIATQIRKLGSTMTGQGTAGLPRGGISEAPGGPPGYLERMGSRIKDAIGEDVSAIGSDIRGISDWVGQVSPFEGEDLPPYMTRGGPPLTESQLLGPVPPGALESGAREYGAPVSIGAPGSIKEKEEAEATGTDYASYLEEIQALERTPEQIKGDAMTNALIELSGLAGAATRAETAEVLRKAGRSAQGIRETGKKELRENILARMQIEAAGDQAELNKRRTESEIRYRDALATQAEYAGSPKNIYQDALKEAAKANGVTPKGNSWATLGLSFFNPAHKQLFIDAYLAERGLTMADVLEAQSASPVGGGRTFENIAEVRQAKVGS